MNDNGDDAPRQVRFRSLMPVGGGAARQVLAELLGEGFDAMLASTVVYGIAEGFSREAGNPPGDPMRFHEGARRHVGADLPEGLEADELRDRSRDAMNDPHLFDALDAAEIEEVCLVIGRDIQRGDPAPRM